MKWHGSKWFTSKKTDENVDAAFKVGALFLGVCAFSLALYLFVSFQNRDFSHFTREEFYLFAVLCGFLGLALVQQAVSASVLLVKYIRKKNLVTEGLAQVYSEKEFNEILKQEMRRGGRYHVPLTICLMKVDDFEAISKNVGEAYGRKLLRKFSELLVSIIRSSDYISTSNQNEFSILLSHTDIVRAESFLFRTMLQAQERLEISFSAGFTAYRSGETAKEFRARAHHALEEASKEGGRKVQCSINPDDKQVIKTF